MSDYKYPADLIKKTDARIQAQLTGNGASAKDIQFSIKRQGIGTFTARTHYDIKCETQSKEQIGHVVQGRVVDIQALSSEIQAYTAKIQSEKSVQDAMKHQIEALPQKGFGADKNDIVLSGQAQTFTSHKKCGSCAGQGQSQCRTCAGQGRSQCQMCHGVGDLQCMICHGTGQAEISGKRQHCNHCQGRGRTLCTHCNGQRSVQCPTCQGKGQMQCKTCQGQGEMSVITTVTPHAVTKSQINIQELDADPKRMVSLIGAHNLAKGDHINITLVKPPQDEEDNKAWYEDKPVIDKSGVFYEATVPWAVGEVSYSGKPYNISLIGKKAAVAESGYFMDEVLKKPATVMQSAAQGDGIVASLLKDACEYRVSRETLTMVIKGQTKRTMMMLQKSYGVGLSKGFIQSFVKSTFLATKKITRRPRYVGLAVGLIVTGALYYYWFMMDGRGVTETQINKIRYAIDGLLMLVGMGLTFATIKGAGHLAMQSVLKDLNINIKKIPAAGMAGVYGLGGCLVIWVVLFALTLMG